MPFFDFTEHQYCRNQLRQYPISLLEIDVIQRTSKFIF